MLARSLVWACWLFISILLWRAEAKDNNHKDNNAKGIDQSGSAYKNKGNLQAVSRCRDTYSKHSAYHEETTQNTSFVLFIPFAQRQDDKQRPKQTYDQSKETKPARHNALKVSKGHRMLAM